MSRLGNELNDGPMPLAIRCVDRVRQTPGINLPAESSIYVDALEYFKR